MERPAMRGALSSSYLHQGVLAEGPWWSALEYVSTLGECCLSGARLASIVLNRSCVPGFGAGHKEDEDQAEDQRTYADSEGRYQRATRIEPLFGKPGADHLGETVEGNHGR